MLVKVCIERKIIPGHEEKFKRLLRELFTIAIHAEGFISGETMQSTEDSTVHLTIGTWKSLSQWESWINSPERKKANEMIGNILSEPVKMASFHYE
jgi:antibiotic biosynthesis monooxygenase (ABM) superfamily enzyme